MVSKVDSYLNYASKAVERKSGRGLKPDFHIFYMFIITVLVIQIFFYFDGVSCYYDKYLFIRTLTGKGKK